MHLHKLHNHNSKRIQHNLKIPSVDTPSPTKMLWKTARGLATCVLVGGYPNSRFGKTHKNTITHEVRWICNENSKKPSPHVHAHVHTCERNSPIPTRFSKIRYPHYTVKINRKEMLWKRNYPCSMCNCKYSCEKIAHPSRSGNIRRSHGYTKSDRIIIEIKLIIWIYG